MPKTSIRPTVAGRIERNDPGSDSIQMRASQAVELLPSASRGTLMRETALHVAR